MQRTPVEKQSDELAQHKEKPRGASVSSRKLADRLNSYFVHHREALNATFLRISDDKLQTFFTALVVAVALSLPGLLLVGLQNIQSLGEQWDSEPKLTLYLNGRAKPEAIERFQKKLESDQRVASVRFISAEQALQEFETFAGFGDALSGLSSNPLPASFEVELSESYRDTATQSQAAQEWQEEAIVDEAAVDLLWVQRFLVITTLLAKVVWMLAIILAVGAVLAIGNTIRLIIENRKDEILVVKLVGGTDAFVKRPLIYTGAIYGLIGALLAALLVWLVLGLSAGAVASVAESYQSSFELQGLSPAQTLILLASGTVIGWFGAMLASHRHIRKIEPR